jgi:hypothetical protein
MHDKVQLGLAVAAHHEFGVHPDLLRCFGATLVADEWLIAYTGQRLRKRGRHADVGFESSSHAKST